MNQKLVLIGGGHSHAIALKEWGLNPLANIDLTLISDVPETPYSGMLPGHVAGFYSYEETHIDLRSLAHFAGAKLVIDRAIELDTENNQVIGEHHQIQYDYLSIDIGSTPQTITVPGAPEYAVPAKPVPAFLQAWYELKQSAASKPAKPLSIVIVGGGAGGVELALNMQACLQEILNDQGKHKLTIHLIHRGQQLLAGHNDWVSNKLAQIMQYRGIQLHLRQSVTEVLPERVICNSGLEIQCTHTYWVTQATAPQWVRKSSLATDQQGFILVKDTLQSISHPQIFAAGDIATMINYSRPKAGVFAVRQGQPLFNNWQRILLDQALQDYTPQEKYLALIGTGDRQAIASWSSWGWRSSLCWWLKDYIDRKFMNQFVDLT
ncbi:MAG: FAD-dependent oxidoreductase [Cyanobacteria bacterium P01_E01_bin.35]